LWREEQSYNSQLTIRGAKYITAGRPCYLLFSLDLRNSEKQSPTGDVAPHVQATCIVCTREMAGMELLWQNQDWPFTVSLLHQPSLGTTLLSCDKIRSVVYSMLNANSRVECIACGARPLRRGALTSRVITPKSKSSFVAKLASPKIESDDDNAPAAAVRCTTSGNNSNNDGIHSYEVGAVCECAFEGLPNWSVVR
jgi:hypothetical protein